MAPPYDLQTLGKNISQLWQGNEAQIALWVQSGTRIGLILFAAWLLRRFFLRGIHFFRLQVSRRSRNDEEKKRFETLERVFRYIVNVLVFTVAGMLVLNELGISIAPILATAGVLGLAIGFGAQSLVKDYFSGFFLLLENQLRHGDVVDLAGKAGLVEEVTLRYVRLRDYEGNVHFIPNGQINVVTNLTREFSYAVIDVGIAYRECVDEAFTLIRETCDAMRKDIDLANVILDDVEIAGVDQWADSAVIIRLRIKVSPANQWGVRREFLRRMKMAFDVAGIEIPFPHLTIYAGQLKDGSAPSFPVQQKNIADNLASTSKAQ